MFKSIKNKLLILSAALGLLVPVALPAVAHAQIDVQNNVATTGCSGSNGDLTSGSTGNCTTSTAGGGLNTLIKNIINIFSIIVGLVAVIMIIIGGFRYILSGGESSSVSGAKNAILFAIVGLVIVAIAQLIVHFVLAKATNQ